MDFEDQVLTLPCGQCGKEFKKTIRWLQSHNEITCDCGGVLRVNSHQLLNVSRTRNDVIDRIRRQFRK